MSLLLLPCQLRTSLDTPPPRHLEAVRHSRCDRWLQCIVSRAAGISPLVFCIGRRTGGTTRAVEPIIFNSGPDSLPDALVQNIAAANPDTPAALTALETSPGILSALALVLQHLTDNMQGPHSVGRTRRRRLGEV